MIKNINIVVLMAGEGTRFKLEGYSEPTPFIEFENKMMIEHVFDSFKNISASFTLVVQEKFLKEKKEKLEKLKEKYDINFSTVPHLTMGAALSALSCHKILNKKYDLLFVDCDNIVTFRMQYHPTGCFSRSPVIRDFPGNGRNVIFGITGTC